MNDREFRYCPVRASSYCNREKCAWWDKGRCGHGLNLQQGGHIIVWFGLTWSLELYQQANARLPRPGQKESVIVMHLICRDTVEEKVLAALQEKDTSQGALLNALKGYLTGGSV